MKNVLSIIVLLSFLTLTACSGSDAPLTKEQQADKYGISVEELDEMSAAAARMNMSLEDHMKMMGN